LIIISEYLPVIDPYYLFGGVLLNSVHLVTPKATIMKKLLFAMLLSTTLIVLTNCKDAGDGGGEGVSAMDFNHKDSMPRTVALSMISHYLDSTVDHSLDAIIKQIYLNSKDVKEMVKSANVKRVKLLTAAYLATDPDPAKQNMPTIIVQLKRVTGSDSTYRYYDIRVVAKSFAAIAPLCPPPNDCAASIED